MRMTISDTPSCRVLPTEGAYPPAVLLAWPHADTDWLPVLDRVDRCYRDIAAVFARLRIQMVILHPDADGLKRSMAPEIARYVIPFNYLTNDTWTRDYGQITVRENGRWTGCDFKFNGWGLKFAAARDNLATRALHDAGVIGGGYDNQLGFVLEGGSIESDGTGTLLTTSHCLMSPNRNGNLDRSAINEVLRHTLGAERVLWLNHGGLDGDDTDSHIDTLARLASPDTIVYTGAGEDKGTQHDGLVSMREELSTFVTAYGQPYNLVELPLPRQMRDDEGNPLPATYCNYLVTPDAILMPTYGQPDLDEEAARRLGNVYARSVISIDCGVLVEQHGSLHCATMQLPRELVDGLHISAENTCDYSI